MTALPKFSPSSLGGRPRKVDAPRYPGGRIKDPTQREIEAEVRSFVDHARGKGIEVGVSRLEASPIGRLIRFGRVKVEGLTGHQLAALADAYAAAYSRWQRAVASRRPLAVTGGPGGLTVRLSDEAEEKEFNAACKAWADISRAVRDAGERVEKALDTVVLNAAPDADETMFAPWVVLSLPAAFVALDRFLSASRR